MSTLTAFSLIAKLSPFELKRLQKLGILGLPQNLINSTKNMLASLGSSLVSERLINKRYSIILFRTLNQANASVSTGVYDC